MFVCSLFINGASKCLLRYATKFFHFKSAILIYGFQLLKRKFQIYVHVIPVYIYVTPELKEAFFITSFWNNYMHLVSFNIILILFSNNNSPFIPSQRSIVLS
jgi:hypothetical protein